jgi:A/G-specific adenine glycosylase
MLQQTPVNRVLPVYERWLTRWPRPGDLAAESAGEAIRAWGRLGYPRRALRLHAAAGAIRDGHGGAVPSTVEDLLRLPGVGEYTARAVAAFAFCARVPVVDTNVRRVLARAVRGVDEPRVSATAADRAEISRYLPADPRTGALVCTATNPACARCPLARRCAWRLGGSVAGVAKRPVQAWHGTDRQVRGRMMAALRASTRPVTVAELLRLGPDHGQAERCLASLLADGLAARAGIDCVVLPG